MLPPVGIKLRPLISSTFKVSPERIVLDLESEVMTAPGSILTGVTLLLDFFVFT